jgi:hypothetical protein
MVMSRNASMTTTLELLRPMVPPALPRTAFFNERDLASKMGNSTHASRVSICGLCGLDTAYRYCPVPEMVAVAVARLARSGRQRALAHLLQLRAGGHLLGEQRGLDAVEQPFQPADQLRLGDAQLGVRRHGTLGERQGEAIEFVAQFRRQTVLELADAGGVDLAQPVAAGFVERCRAHFLEQLLDHGADAHHLGGLLDQVGQGALIRVVVAHRHEARIAAPDDLDAFEIRVIVAGTQSSHHPWT